MRGMDAKTGKELEGIEHLKQSITDMTLPRKSGEKVENVFTKRMMNQKAQGCNS